MRVSRAHSNPINLTCFTGECRSQRDLLLNSHARRSLRRRAFKILAPCSTMTNLYQISMNNNYNTGSWGNDDQLISFIKHLVANLGTIMKWTLNAAEYDGEKLNVGLMSVVWWLVFILIFDPSRVLTGMHVLFFSVKNLSF